MVAYPSGPIIHRFRRSALVESAPGRSHVDLADSMVRDCVRNPGDHSWVPLAQFTDNPCALVGATNSILVSFIRPLCLLSEQIRSFTITVLYGDGPRVKARMLSTRPPNIQLTTDVRGGNICR